jgi:hypothetical protein
VQELAVLAGKTLLRQNRKSEGRTFSMKQRSSRWHSIAALAVAIAVTAVPAGSAAAQTGAKDPAAEGPAEVRKQLEKLYQEEARVVKQKDPKSVRRFYDSVLAPDFTDKSGSMVLKRKHYLNDMEQNAREVRSIDVTQKLDRLTLQDKIATALVRYNEKGVLMDHRGKKHTFTRTAVFKQLWTRKADRWTMKRRELVKEESFLVDGKPVPTS